MPTLIDRGAAWLGTKLKDAAGVDVVYVRGSSESEPITGTVARYDYEVMQDDGAILLVTSYDWTFTTSDLPHTPRSGDRLRATLNGVASEFEVAPIGKLPCQQRLDAAGILTLAHTKKVT